MKYERFLGDSRWSYFFKSFLEYDEFKAFDLRLVANTGLGYLLVSTETIKLKGRFGAGASREFGGPDDELTPEAVFGGDYDWAVTQAAEDQRRDWTTFPSGTTSPTTAW